MLPVTYASYAHFSSYQQWLWKSAVLTVVVMKSSIFWDIMSCSLLKVNRRFERTCCLYFLGRRISQARTQRESKWQSSIIRRLHVPSKSRLTFRRLHGIYIPDDRTLNDWEHYSISSTVWNIINVLFWDSLALTTSATSFPLEQIIL
jgi:hypothetical protein